MDGVLKQTEAGIYCPDGGFYIDPLRPVARAVITHAHADHARPGMGHYLATPGTVAMLRHRLGEVSTQILPFGAELAVGGVTVSLHPSGHLPGAAQVRVAQKGEVWVASGDYKLAPDGLAEPFEPVPCHAFITESTFGLPVFNWPDQAEVAAEITAWCAKNRVEGRMSVIGTYSLGKAQRLISCLADTAGPILCHGAISATNEVLRAQGLHLPDSVPITPELDPSAHPGALVLAPPSALGSGWAKRLGQAETGFASGWMAMRGIKRRRSVGRGFVLSDHADWPGLNAAIKATGATQVFVTHGYTQSFTKWLRAQGYDAHILHIGREAQAEGDDG